VSARQLAKTAAPAQQAASLQLDVPARSQDGRTLVPMRFIAEGLKQVVTWFPGSQMIVITDEPRVKP